MSLEAWFPGRAPGPALRARLGRFLGDAGIDRRAGPRLRLVGDGRWVEAWQRSLRPMRIGRRILAVPEGAKVPAARGRFVLRIPFGQAFGTGEHATTRLCLRFLEGWLRAGDRVADVGTGTGILSVAAARLGAGSVLAVDADPVVVRVARETLRRNRVAGRVRLARADGASALARRRFDLVVVNIGTGVIAGLLPRLARALRPGGRAILSGLLIDDETGILARAREAGLRPAARRRVRPWSALVLVRMVDRPSGLFYTADSFRTLPKTGRRYERRN